MRGWRARMREWEGAIVDSESHLASRLLFIVPCYSGFPRQSGRDTIEKRTRKNKRKRRREKYTHGRRGKFERVVSNFYLLFGRKSTFTPRSFESYETVQRVSLELYIFANNIASRDFPFRCERQIDFIVDKLTLSMPLIVHFETNFFLAKKPRSFAYVAFPKKKKNKNISQPRIFW